MPPESITQLLVPLLAACIWFVASPLVVGASDPRMRERNPDHFAHLVRLSRLWGTVACMIGFAIAYAI